MSITASQSPCPTPTHVSSQLSDLKDNENRLAELVVLLRKKLGTVTRPPANKPAVTDAVPTPGLPFIVPLACDMRDVNTGMSKSCDDLSEILDLLEI